MAEVTKKPHNPREGCAIHIQVDLNDLCRKTVKFGPLHVLGETILNLCLMANDHKNGGKPVNASKSR